MDRRWILGGLLFVGGVGLATAAAAKRSRLHAGTRLMLVGDSFAQGMLPYFEGLAKDEGIAFLGAGVRGSMVGQWTSSEWLQDKLATWHPTVVVVVLGGNDAYSNLAPSKVAQSAKRLVEIINAAGAEVVWIGMPTLPAKYYGKSPNPKVLEALPVNYDSSRLDIPRGPDALHPTAKGYAGWAGAIWNWL